MISPVPLNMRASLNLTMLLVYIALLILSIEHVAPFSQDINFRGICGVKRTVALSMTEERIVNDADGNPASATIGSDALIRPDDEDSPEFQLYLQQLLRMQANRARTGYSAPSSRSTDAYFAKLNRLKLEKLARFRAGLPDEPLDTSYKPVDFEYAADEATDVSIAASDGGAAGGGRARRVSTMERKLAALAEQAAEEALKNTSAGTKCASSNSQINVAGPKASQSPKTSAVDAVASRPTMTAEQSGGDKIISFTQNSAEQRVSKVNNAGNFNSDERTSTVRTRLKRELSNQEVNSVGRALQYSIMHRGGGPFGSGRLHGEKLNELVSALAEAYALLVEDARLASPEFVTSSSGAVEQDITRLPALKTAAISPNMKSEPVVVVAAAAAPPTSADVSTSCGSHGSPNEENRLNAGAPQQTIAQGLDAFLLQPAALSMEELCDLREGIRQCSLMISSEIEKRSETGSDAESFETFRSGTSVRRSSNEIQEMKVALGLLLKHRGGPGFGHGRLTGKELDLLEENLRKVASFVANEAITATGQ